MWYDVWRVIYHFGMLFIAMKRDQLCFARVNVYLECDILCLQGKILFIVFKCDILCLLGKLLFSSILFLQSELMFKVIYYSLKVNYSFEVKYIMFTRKHVLFECDMLYLPGKLLFCRVMDDRYSNLFLNAYINRHAHTEHLKMIEVYSPLGIWHVFLYSTNTKIYHFGSMMYC